MRAMVIGCKNYLPRNFRRPGVDGNAADLKSVPLKEVESIESPAGTKASNKYLIMADHILNKLADEVHRANAKWWVDITTGQPIQRNVGEMIALVHSEMSEALEGHRKNLPDDKLPHRPMLEVELADAVIRILDLAAGLGLDIGGAYEEKMAYNAVRADHKLENRRLENGKKY